MQHPTSPSRAFALRARKSVIARACFAALLLNSNAWSQAIPVNTTAGQFTAKSGNASLVGGLPSGQTVIRLDNSKSVLEWVRLNVAQGNSLQFIQPNQQSVVLNRVTGSEVTRIDGSLLSNGHVWLLNPSGVLFGANSSVNVQSLLATTRAISDADFLTNKLHFAGGGTGHISNAGVISVGEGGYVVLSAQSVENIGSIQAQLGQVHLASGKAFVIDLNGDKLLRFDVTQALSSSDATESLVKNSGSIFADGGRVQMTARAANGLVGQVVNTGGLLQANSVRSVNGEIVLDAGPGGRTSVGGALSAQGLNANSQGGNVTALGDNIQIASGARINASGQAGGGNVLIGGDWQGSGSLQQAKTVEMQAGSEIKANATLRGDGGKVVLWSNVKQEGSQTSVAGTIEAKGGLLSGNGGQVETSGRDLKIANTTSVNAGSTNGSGGKWLLDPVNVVIDATSASTITNSLASTDVAVTASGASASISVNAPLTWGANLLSLESSGNVYINDIVTARGAFAGLIVKTGYSTPGVNGGTYDNTKSLLFGLSSSGFKGRINIQDASGVARGGFGFVLNGNNYALINDATSLQNNLAAGLAGNYALTGDIDASATASWNAGAGFAPIGNNATRFTGRFNGLGHTISNLTINRGLSNEVGLFGYTTGSIQSLGLINITVAGYANVGALAGVNLGGKISNVYVLNSANLGITGVDTVGGLIGLNASNAQVSNSWVTAPVSGLNAVGGFVGYNQASAISSSYYSVAGLANPDATTVSLLPTANFPATLGGFVGTNEGGTISNSYANANVIGKILTVGQTGGALAGGFVGYNFSGSSITDSYATGKVTADFNVIGQPRLTGSFVGQNSAIISNTYTTASFNGGDPVFGFSDYAPGIAYITNSYAPSLSQKYNPLSYSFDGTNQNTFFVDNTGAGTGALLTSPNWLIYSGHTAPLLSNFLTPLTVSIASTAKVYDGTNNYASTATYSGLSSGSVDVSKLNIVSTLSGKNVGLQALTVDAWSTQEGYSLSVNAPSLIAVNPATLKVTATGLNKAYDGNTKATVYTADNRIGNDDVSIATSANFADALVGTNKVVRVSDIRLSGLDAANYVLANTSLVTTANINPSQTNAAIQTTVSAAMPSAASVNLFATPTLTTATKTATTSTVAATSISSDVSSSTTATVSATVTTSTNNGSPEDVPIGGATNQAGVSANANSTANGSANISVNTQTVAKVAPAVASQANTTAQTVANAGVATSNSSQVQIVSLNTTSSPTSPVVGAQTITPVQTPKSAEDQSDPVLAAVNSFKPATPANTNNRAPARGRDASVVVPLVQGVLVMETSPPKAATQAVDERRLSASGDRSRW